MHVNGMLIKTKDNSPNKAFRWTPAGPWTPPMVAHMLLHAQLCFLHQHQLF